MEIPPRFNHCIWCGHPFSIKGFCVRPGQVHRSLEHIIPDNVFGRLVIEDVCIPCNSKLGSNVDDLLLNDGHIVTAGLAAGFKADQLLRDFRVCGNTPDGEAFEYRVKEGVWRLEPTFTPDGFKIGAINNCSNERDLENAKRKMLKVVIATKSGGLNEVEARKWIDDLFAEFLAKQGQYTVYRAQIRQGLRGRFFQAKGTLTITTQPWETQWGIAKIAYEVAHVMLPCTLMRRLHSSLTQLKAFIEVRMPKHCVFTHQTLAVKAEPRHEIEITVSGAKLCFRIRMFNREQWILRFNVLKDNEHACLDDYRLLVVNECCYHKQTSSVQVCEQHAQRRNQKP